MVIMESSTTSLQTVINAVSDVFDFAGTCLDQIINQPVLLFLFATGLIPVGLAIVRRLKRTASAS